MKLVFQLRRQARLRREYLYRKSLEGRKKAIQDKKDRLRQALEGMFNSYSQVFLKFNE